MQDFQEDFYQTLGVEEKSTPEEIRKAYLKLAKRLHPDRFPNAPEKRAEAQAEFSKVTRAHDVLADAKQREEYDGIRQLTKNKLAIETGVPQTQAQAQAPSEAPSPAVEKGETRESWASKHYSRAGEMLNRKKFPEAENAIKEALRLCPNNSSFHVLLAEIHLARGWRTLAMTDIQSALKIDPKNQEAKEVELKLKSSAKSSGAQKGGKPGDKQKEAVATADGKKGFLDQLKELLNKKM